MSVCVIIILSPACGATFVCLCAQCVLCTSIERFCVDVCVIDRGLRLKFRPINVENQEKKAILLQKQRHTNTLPMRFIPRTYPRFLDHTSNIRTKRPAYSHEHPRTSIKGPASHKRKAYRRLEKHKAGHRFPTSIILSGLVSIKTSGYPRGATP